MALVAGLLAAACGAKSGLRVGDAGPVDAAEDSPVDAAGVVDAGVDAAPECRTAEDCPTPDSCESVECVDGRCVAGGPTACDDGDSCTRDECDPGSGTCRHSPLTFDRDRDGFPGPRPGYAAGAPGSCGDDCDDTSPLAYPGGKEVCDGVDNDCNGVVDDDARYEPVGKEAILVSDGSTGGSARGGLAWNGEAYGATYSASLEQEANHFELLDAQGKTVGGPTAITNVSSDAFAGPLVWTGAEFGVAWEDRRDDDFEIYFNRLDPKGEKLGPDVRVTDAPNFSIHPSLIWTGAEYLLAWDDQRLGPARIYVQRIGADGLLIGGEEGLVSDSIGAESPYLAEGTTRIGVAFNVGNSSQRSIVFRSFSPDLEDLGPVVVVDKQQGLSPSMVWSGDRFILAWHTRTNEPGDAIWAAAVSEDGDILVTPRRVATGGTYARTQSLLALGDRVLLVWGDDRDGNYELYVKMLDNDLEELAPRKRITTSSAHTLGPFAAFGPDGDVGVLFEDHRTGLWQTYFTRLACRAGK
ncbi:MAG: putative metal-binding motif-containing protein [Polyangiaceae bacterium]|nr:putative metal-binding motif-containing protein [Polyangiaceae bacterium]